MHLVGLSPDPDHEERLLSRCKDLTCKIRLHVHYSFTALVDAGIIEPGVEKLLRAMGVNSEKAISDRRGRYGGMSRMLSPAIARARRKAAAKSG